MTFGIRAIGMMPRFAERYELRSGRMVLEAVPKQV